MAVAMAPSAVSASPRSSAVAKVSSVALDERRRVAAQLLAGVGPGAAEHFHEGIEQDRVEVAPALFAHHLDRLVDGEGLSVDTVAGERVEDVGDGDDPALDRDRLALQAPRVAASRPTSPGG